MDLAQRLASKDMIVGVIGLGYVGLPLAVGFGGAGLRVLGVDVDTARLESLRRGESYLMDVAGRDVAGLVEGGRLTVTSDYDDLARADAIFICVPTPFTATKAPDISYIVAVAKGVAKRLRRGQVIILQSTTHPGTTGERFAGGRDGASGFTTAATQATRFSERLGGGHSGGSHQRHRPFGCRRE